jgi:hypothetical protein
MSASFFSSLTYFEWPCSAALAESFLPKPMQRRPRMSVGLLWYVATAAIFKTPRTWAQQRLCRAFSILGQCLAKPVSIPVVAACTSPVFVATAISHPAPELYNS